MSSNGALAALLVAACGGNAPKPVEPAPIGAPPPATPDAAPTPAIGGVPPEQFDCASLTTIDELAKILGGTVNAVDNVAPTPRGLAKPCGYLVQTGSDTAAWAYDIDCRDGFEERAAKLVDQYREQPGGHPVEIGKRGFDLDRALLFVDDDAPCYVRVIGNDETAKLALAKVLAKKLTFANAPMTPRSKP